MNLKDKISPLIKGEAHWDQKINKTVDTITDYLVEGPDYIVRGDLNTVVSPNIDMISPASDIEIHGRTLINLLGRSGNAIYQQAESATTSVEYNGNDFVFTNIVNDKYIFLPKINYVAGKYYLFLYTYTSTTPFTDLFRPVHHVNKYFFPEMKNREDINGENTFTGYCSVLNDITQLSNLAIGTTYGNNEKVLDESFKVSFIRMYEISKEVHDKINVDPEYTGDKLAEKFPYVDDVKCVVNPYIECKENLLDGVNWFRGETVPNVGDVDILNVDSKKFLSSAVSGLLPNTTYTFRLDDLIDTTLFRAHCIVYTGSSELLYNNGDTNCITFTTPEHISAFRISFARIRDVDIIPDTMLHIIRKMTLVKGSIPKTYDECTNSRIMFETVLRGGEKITKCDDGSYVKNTNNDKFINIDKNIIKSIVNNGDIKTISLYKIANIASRVLDYKEIEHPSIIKTDVINIDIDKKMSGWGPNYTPNTDEIEAFFLGWRMRIWGQVHPYDGTGKKCWDKLYCGMGTPNSPENMTVLNTHTGDLPKVLNDLGYKEWKIETLPPSIEKVKTYGSLVIVPDVDIIVSSGLIMNEKASQRNTFDGRRYFSVHNGLLEHRSSTFLKFVQNDINVSFYNDIHSAENTINHGNGQAFVLDNGDSTYIIDYMIYNPDTIKSFNCKFSVGSNPPSVIKKTIKEIHEIMNENEKLNKEIESLRQLSNPNLLINGDFQIWQRGTKINYIDNNTSNGVYLADRWYHSFGGTNQGKISKSDNGMRLEVTKSDPSTWVNLEYAFDLIDYKKLIGKPVTVSIKLHNPELIETIGIRAHPNNPIIVKNTKISDFYTFTTVVPECVNCTRFMFYLQKQSLGVLEIEYIKLELGDRETPHVSRSYQEELSDCQRYYYKSDFNRFEIVEHVSVGSNLSFTLGSMNFPSLMRTQPTITIIGGYNKTPELPDTVYLLQTNTNIGRAVANGHTPRSLLSISLYDINLALIPKYILFFKVIADAEIY